VPFKKGNFYPLYRERLANNTACEERTLGPAKGMRNEQGEEQDKLQPPHAGKMEPREAAELLIRQERKQRGALDSQSSLTAGGRAKRTSQGENCKDSPSHQNIRIIKPAAKKKKGGIHTGVSQNWRDF